MDTSANPLQLTDSQVSHTLRLGIDIGGTFTDFVVFRPFSGEIDSFKLPSTPDDPSRVVLEGIGQILRDSSLDGITGIDIIHGSTVATNALLERKGARTALITTQGFRDVLQIGRQARSELYDLSADPPAPIIPYELRFSVSERVNHRGEVLEKLEPFELESIIHQLETQQVESTAVCLLFSFLFPEHERTIAERLRRAGFFVSASYEVLSEYREYERTSTTSVNAYVSPVLDRYLDKLQSGLQGEGKAASMRVMQSNGGSISIDEARANAVRCILSGPAGGVAGAMYTAAVVERQVRVISFDMGGTSTDVSLVEGEPKVTSEALVGGCPIRVPVIDIHTIGAGGGSIAFVDPGTVMRVGPHSAGADPGPACYGKGDAATVTDANLVLGRLAADKFLGGKLPLDEGRALDAVSELGGRAGLGPHTTALGIVEIVNAHMERAIRVISVERGYDPRDFALLSFGGAGGLHAVDLARRSGIKHVLVPPLASTLSAFGMLAVDVVKDYSRTVMLDAGCDHKFLLQKFESLAEKARLDLDREGIPQSQTRIEKYLDMRYRGQSYELLVPYSGSFSNNFHEAHRRVYGYDQPQAPVEIVNIRLRAVGKVSSPEIKPMTAVGNDSFAEPFDIRPVIFRSPNGQIKTASSSFQEINTPFYRWENLPPGARINGPAVVVRTDTTVLLEEEDNGNIDDFGNLSISVSQL